jgi:hypothetical protein
MVSSLPFTIGVEAKNPTPKREVRLIWQAMWCGLCWSALSVGPLKFVDFTVTHRRQ